MRNCLCPNFGFIYNWLILHKYCLLISSQPLVGVKIPHYSEAVHEHNANIVLAVFGIQWLPLVKVQGYKALLEGDGGGLERVDIYQDGLACLAEGGHAHHTGLVLAVGSLDQP